MIAATRPAHAAEMATAPLANEVLSRPRPGLDPTGLTLGGMRLFLSLDAGVAYDDNIYSRDTQIVESTVYMVRPQISARSNWNVHRLNFDASGDFERYSNAKTENSDQYRVHSDGQLDISRAVALTAEGVYDRVTEPRGTLGDAIRGGEPSMYRNYSGALGTSITLGRLQLRSSVQAGRTTYNDVRVGPLLISQRNRNRKYYEAQAEVSHAIGVSLSAYVQARFDRQRYELQAGSFSQDSNGTTLLGGVDFGITRLLSGRIGVGYLKRTYRSPTFSKSSGLTYDATVNWSPTTLLALTVKARKSIAESPEIDVSGIVSNGASITADYEVLRNLIVRAYGAYAHEKYRGIDRVDKRRSVGLSARYLLNRFAELGVAYDRVSQNGSGVTGRSYRSNVARISLKVQK